MEIVTVVARGGWGEEGNRPPASRTYANLPKEQKCSNKIFTQLLPNNKVIACKHNFVSEGIHE
jgi:hypothetical protein